VKVVGYSDENHRFVLEIRIPGGLEALQRQGSVIQLSPGEEADRVRCDELVKIPILRSREPRLDVEGAATETRDYVLMLRTRYPSD